MQIRLLGPLEVEGPAGQLNIPGRKERALLTWLALRANEVVSEARLIDLLWGERPPRTAAKTVQAYLSRLRGVLAAAGESDVTIEAGRGLCLRVPPSAIDVGEVEQLLDDARNAVKAGDGQRGVELLDRALALWRGEPLADLVAVVDDAAVAAEAARLVELRQVIVEERIDALLASGRAGELVPELETLVAAHPLRERLWGQRMLALYRAGRQADALRVYQQLREVLAEELGLEPSPDLRDLESAILRQSPALTVATQSPLSEARAVFTVVFTDIVGSTDLASRYGDARWRTVLDAHDDLVRTQLARHRGREVGTQGDGFLAVFDAPRSAIACVEAIVADVRKLGIEIRAGIHAGECVLRGDDIGGITVHVAARISAKAGASEILVSGTVHDLVAGSDVRMTDRGWHSMKGLERRWHLYAVGTGAQAVRKGPAKKATKPKSKRATASSSKDRQRRISVLLVDDHPLWRESIRNVIEHKANVKVIAEAALGLDGIELAAQHRPDVIIMDIDLPDVSGIDATRRVLARDPDAKVLVLSSSKEREQVAGAVRAGALGYLVKTAAGDEIATAISRVDQGELVFPPELARVVAAELRGPTPTTAAADTVVLVGVSVVERAGLSTVLGAAGWNVSVAAGTAELGKCLAADAEPIFIGDLRGAARGRAKVAALLEEARRDHPKIPILVLLSDPAHARAVAFLGDAGAGTGLVMADRLRDPAHLVDLVRRVAAGEVSVDAEVTAELLQRSQQPEMADLREREREVLARMAEGQSNQAIAEDLGLSVKTVETHIATIFSKLGLEASLDAHRRVQAVLAYLGRENP